jgi:YHS domain-containing protein
MCGCCGSSDHNHQDHHRLESQGAEKTASAKGSFLDKMKGFLGSVKTAKDPVCGMKVSVSQAEKDGLVKEKEGKKYYFCSKDCWSKF